MDKKFIDGEEPGKGCKKNSLLPDFLSTGVYFLAHCKLRNEVTSPNDPKVSVLNLSERNCDLTN